MGGIPVNIQLFNLTTLAVFARLYENFPKPIHITPGTIGIELTASDVNADHAWNAMEVAEHSVEWLAQEGFLRYGERLGGKFARVVLTHKGLAVLGSVPKAITPVEVPTSMYNRIKGVLASGGKVAAEESARTVVQELLKLGLGAGLTSAL